MYLSHLIYTVWPCLIHTCHAMSMPCSDMLCFGFEKNGMVGAWHGHGMASVNQTRPHCVNQMGKIHSKPLAARHGRGTAWARHGHSMLCVNRPLNAPVGSHRTSKLRGSNADRLLLLCQRFYFVVLRRSDFPPSPYLKYSCRSR